jgi:glycosyltransferase involved in cell wall biosynthesis
MSPQEHRVAFLLPVYQAQQDFDDTMDSLAQSTLPCTVFVVDDGSQPPLQVADYGPRLDVRLLRRPQNQGIVAAMNFGLQAALDAGFEFIARIDAGDYARPDRLARQLEYLDRHPRCMMVGSDAEVRDQFGRWRFNLQPPRDPSALARALHERAWLLHPSVMYRARVFHEVGLYSDKFKAAEDYEMFLRIASRYEIGVVPEALLIYVTRNAGISGRKTHTQAVNRLRIQMRYFQWANWLSYYGAIRTLGTLLLPRNMKTILKLKFLYGRIDCESESPAESGSRLNALPPADLKPMFRENQQRPSPKTAME